MDVNWDPPAQMNGLLRQYTVTYTGTLGSQATATSSTSTTLTGLEACTTYTVTVTATNGASENGEGMSQPSSGATGNTTAEGEKYLMINHEFT